MILLSTIHRHAAVFCPQECYWTLERRTPSTVQTLLVAPLWINATRDLSALGSETGPKWHLVLKNGSHNKNKKIVSEDIFHYFTQ